MASKTPNVFWTYIVGEERKGEKKKGGEKRDLLTFSYFLELHNKSITKMHFHVQPIENKATAKKNDAAVRL